MAAIWVIKLVPFSFPMHEIQTLRQLESVGPYSLGVPCGPSVTPKQFLTSNRAPVFRQLGRQWDRSRWRSQEEGREGSVCLCRHRFDALRSASGGLPGPSRLCEAWGRDLVPVSKQGLPEKPLEVSRILAFFHILGECPPCSGAVVL